MVLLSACGFHLRGLMDKPLWLDRVAVVLEHADRDLQALLLEQLKANAVRVCADPSQARYWLIVEQEDLRQHITSISSSTTPRQFQLVYSVRFRLQDPKGAPKIASQAVVVTRQLTVNSDRILGSNFEEATLDHEMRREASVQILQRLSQQRS